MPPFDPSAALGDMEDIDGAFEIEVVARFDDILAGYWQRVIDFGDGPGGNNILLAQVENTSDMVFAIYQDGASHRVIAPDAIAQGEVATWNIGVEPDGLMWIAKNGARLAEAPGVVPADTSRLNELLGESNWAGDAPLEGAVLGIDVTNEGETADGGFLNAPENIAGAFRVDAAVRFDDLEGRAWQGVFDFADSAGTSSIALTQDGASGDMTFVIVQDGETHSITAEDAIAEGEMAHWAVGVEADGTMWMEKDGARLAEGQGVVPANVARDDLRVGDATEAGGAAIDGVVLDLTVTQDGTVDPPAPPEEPTDPEEPPVTDPPPEPENPVAEGDIPQIDGAFRIDVSVRFDDLQGAYWQRVVDFGDGPNSNNIILGQIENTGDMMLEIWTGGEAHRVVAEGAIVQGETAEWSAGVDPDGLMWIEKDGARLAEADGAVPEDVDRENLLVGESNWPEDDALVGEISGIEVTALSEPSDPGTGDPTDPTDPVDPVDPTDPTDPADPTDPTDPADPTPPVTGAGDMIFVAHQDDDLLFMNPTISDLIDGDAPVTTVYLTAGDAGMGEDYWSEREAGEKDAYGEMAGANDWVDETVSVSVGDSQHEVASSYLASDPDIRLYFLRLPDGFQGTGSETYGGESLEKLWDGRIDTMTAVDGSASYSSEELSGVLTQLMERHTPDQVHIQDHTSEHTDLEHSDHVHASEFSAQAAAAYSGTLTITSYYGYATWGFEENVEGAAHEEMRDVFMQYAAHDTQVWAGEGMLIDSYEEWLQREYVLDRYSHDGMALASQSEEDAEAAHLALEEQEAESDPLII